MAFAGRMSVGRWSLAWSAALLLAILSAVLGWWVELGWFAFTSLALVVLLQVGLVATVLLSPRHRMLWRLARRNAARRRRNAALVVLGLLIGSAIVSSSLIVGDSLEATIRGDVLVWLDEVDLQVAGRDPLTGQLINIPEATANALAGELAQHPQVDAVGYGLQRSVSVRAPATDLGEPSATWLALDPAWEANGSWNALGGSGGVEFAAIRGGEVVVNRPLADELEIAVGDEVVVSWGGGVLAGSGGRQTLRVQAIVSTAGSAAPAGGNGPAMFTTLSEAQRLQDLEGEVNVLRVSAEGGVEDSLDAEAKVYPDLVTLLDTALGAEQAGLDLQSVAGGGWALSRTTGLGLLEAELVRSVSENLSGLDVVETSLFQSSVLSLRDAAGTNLSGLPDAQLDEIVVGPEAWWFATPAGLGVLEASGGWSLWPTNGSSVAVQDLAFVGPGEVLVAHAGGLQFESLAARSGAVDAVEGTDMRAVTVAGGWAVALGTHTAEGVQTWGPANSSDSWVADVWAPAGVAGDILTMELASDDQQVHALVETLFGRWGCTISLGQLGLAVGNGSAPTWFCSQEPGGERGLVALDGVVWTATADDLLRRSAPAGGSAQALGLPAGRVIGAGGDGVWVEGAGLWRWNGTGFVADARGLPNGSVAGGLWIDDERALVGGPDGLLIRDADGDSGRLPLQRELAGVGRLPLLVIATDGEVPGLPTSPGLDGIVLADWALEALGLEVGERLDLVGLIAASRGDFSARPVHVTDTLGGLPAVAGQPGIETVVLGVVDLETAARLSAAELDDRSLVIVVPVNNTTGPEVETALRQWADEASTAEVVGLGVSRTKRAGLELAEETAGQLAGLFLVFGAFTVVAGLLLVVNIFVMLAEERKPEMGMLRALGMQRGDLRTLFVIEGGLSALIASAVGSLSGLVVAFAVISAFQFVFSAAGASIVFGWTASSLIAGFAAGFLVTWLTLWATALRNSRLDVVAALRAIPRPAQGLPWWTLLIVLVLAGGGLVAIILGAFVFDRDVGGFAHVAWVTGGFLLLLSLLPPFLWLTPRLLPEVVRLGPLVGHRSLLAPRLAMGGIGALVLLWGAAPLGLDPVRNRMEPNEVSFIVIGLFLIGAGVLLITALAPLIVRLLGRLAGRSRLLSPVVPTALAHPLSTPFRTGMTLAMFSLVIFSITVLTGWTAQFEASSDRWTEQSQGDFELVAFGSRERPIDLGDDPAEWTWGEADPATFDAISEMYLGVVTLTPALDEDPANASTPYIVRGIDAAFGAHGGLPLFVWDESLGDEADVWSAVAADPTLAVVDASFGLEGGQVPGFGFLAPIDTPITIADPLNPSVNRTVRVVGILEQGSLLTVQGVFVQDELAVERFSAVRTRVYLSVGDEVSLGEKEDLAKALERAWVDDGLQVSVIESDVRELRSVLFAILDVFQAYLGLGLIVGVAGLGVVTVRAVSERQHQTGVLRALGFQRRMVVLGYLLELSWISLLGIVNGLVIGIGFHVTLYREFFAEQGDPFVLPWGELLVLSFGAYLLTLVATAWPVRQAAGVAPAEVLRSVD